jgi:LysM repeat protein
VSASEPEPPGTAVTSTGSTDYRAFYAPSARPMHDHGRRSPARYLAPLALVAFSIAFFGILLSSGGDEEPGGPDRAAQTESGGQRTTAEQQRPKRPATYTVKTGDTLGAIAEKTGVGIEELQELNPELDPQALVSGQKIKLRE